jgi:hypothetical protein
LITGGAKGENKNEEIKDLEVSSMAENDETQERDQDKDDPFTSGQICEWGKEDPSQPKESQPEERH